MATKGRIRAASPLLRPLVLGSVGLAVLAGGCGEGGDNGRNAVAYCKAFYTHASPIRKQFEDINAEGVDKDPLGAFVSILSAPNDLATVFSAMADHADDSIRADTEAVRDSYEQASKNMGQDALHPVAGLVDGLSNAVGHAGSMTRVSNYLDTHCPKPNSAQARQWIDAAGGAGGDS